MAWASDVAPIFKPHGLITNAVLHNFYVAAHIDSYVKGMHDPKEHQTVELLENILNKVIFRNMDYVFINSQQPPGLQSSKACDIVVKHANPASTANVLCFIECKRTKRTTNYDLGAVEEQALKYCQEYLESTGKNFVFACTAIGAHLKLWSLSLGDKKMQGLWGTKSGLARWEEYKDIGDDQDGDAIMNFFHQMVGRAPHSIPGESYEDYASSHAILSAMNEEDEDEDDEDEDEEGEDNEEGSQAGVVQLNKWIWDAGFGRYRRFDGQQWHWQEEEAGRS